MIDALRQLESAHLVFRRAEASPLLSRSRRDALKQIVRTSAGAATLPLVLTLTAAEQRLHAQGTGTPVLNLTGTWSGTIGTPGDEEPVTWTATQSGNSVTGPFVVDLGGGDSVSGTMSGTISGTALAVTVTIPPGGVSGDPPCSVTGTGTSPATTNTSITVSLTLVGTGCTDPIDSPLTLTLSRT